MELLYNWLITIVHGDKCKEYKFTISYELAKTYPG